MTMTFESCLGIRDNKCKFSIVNVILHFFVNYVVIHSPNFKTGMEIDND